MPRRAPLTGLLLLLAACSDAPVTGTDGEDGTASDTGSMAEAGTDAGNDAGNDATQPTMATMDTPTGGAGVPTCDDGERNGDESDVDCGGPCGPCNDNALCKDDGDCRSGLCYGTCIALYPSCYQMHLYHAMLPDGDYGIDPDGDGVATTFRCDMQNGGWTEVARDDLDAPAGWSAGSPGTCGTLGDHLLGGAGQFGVGAIAEKTFPLQGVPHTDVKVLADVIIIDTWETESMILEIDGQSVASAVCSQGIPGSCGIMTSQCGQPGAGDGSLRLIGMRPLAADSATVRFSSSLDQPADDEAWGLDSVAVQVR